MCITILVQHKLWSKASAYDLQLSILKPSMLKHKERETVISQLVNILIGLKIYQRPMLIYISLLITDFAL